MSHRTAVARAGASALAVLILWPALLAAATPGKDGPRTVSALGTVVNEYGVLAADAAVGATSVTVTSIANLPSLSAGDLVMIYQAQGATIDSTDTVNYGTVSSLNGAGNYELVGVTSVASNVVNLEATCGGLRNAYTAAGHTQVIRVPQYSTLTINAGGSVVASPWDGQRGGVVAVDVQAAVTLNGPIDVTGRGFRGGAMANSNANSTPVPTYRQTLPSLGATKGESIAGSVTTYDGLSGRYGRGAPANGGGGGNNHNAAGGGGANGDNARSWWITVGTVGGQGVMDGTVTGAGAPEFAWTLDPGYIANGNALTNCGGGGRGGYACADTTALSGNFLTYAPGSLDGYWGCQNSHRSEIGGLGGRPVANDPTARLFFGGGGGAGQTNNNVGGSGGNGGGLVVLVTAGAITGSSSVLADGAAGGNASVNPQGTGSSDAPGGGGGGGSIVIRAGSLSGIAARARGGVGGTQTQPTVSPDYEGAGGGGGGGYIATSASSITKDVSGGSAGTSLHAKIALFPTNGATRGASGRASDTASTLPICSLPTAVRLMSFEAVGGDGLVELRWRTGSELGNLGFHVYRGPGAEGPWDRLTSSLIPGQGFSAVGESYRWVDAGLVNGVRYYYRLEDVDAASASTFHGPVSAVPTASPLGGGGAEGGDGAAGVGAGGGGTGDGSCPGWVLASAPDAVSPVCTRHGEPESVSLTVVSRDDSSATVDVRTGGFWALHESGGGVRVFVPGLGMPTQAQAPALPVRRALVDAVVGKGVELGTVEATEIRVFRDLRPSAVGMSEMVFGEDGTVRAWRRAGGVGAVSSRGPEPAEVARLSGVVFQGERKSAVLEVTPVRYSASRGGLVLAGRVRVTLGFTGKADEEVGTGGVGRALPRRRSPSRDVLAQLHTSRRGLHAVRYEDAFGRRARPLSTASLRLQRQGEAVPFHVEPSGGVFGPGSVLYFFADRTAASTDDSSEVAYELVRGTGVPMEMVVGTPLGAQVPSPPAGSASFETNRIYQPGLLEAPDIWLWDWMGSGVERTEGFTLAGIDTGASGLGRLVVHLQGGSESGTVADHHVRVSVNGVGVGEATFAGVGGHSLKLEVPASALREGANELALTNVGDTGVYSLVFLDRFEVSYPQASAVRRGVFEGTWSEAGTAAVAGLSGPPVVLDVTGAPRWVSGLEVAGSTVRFEVEAGHRYVVVGAEGVLRPRVGRMAFSTLKRAQQQADYLVIAPREFLGAATPLLERRRGEGLSSRGVSFEAIVSEFGHGQPSAEAIKEFLSYAYHHWRRPSPRYVLLLGDATDDPQHFRATSWASPLPALWEKTSYLWTASDPSLAAVNGEDSLPDLAIGRLPATTREQAEALVGKVLAWEDSGQGLGGKAVLVADTPGQAGDFEADVEDVRASFLLGRETATLKVRELGSEARPAILGAFDEGASLMSYVGHGGSAVWSSSNVLNSWDTEALLAQSRQPVLLTLNCLNGYFVAPNFDSLSEALLKAEGRGAIAAVSPSGLSLDGPAHAYHRAVMAELTSGRHERLGDAILAAQTSYAETGLMPELLTIYQLLGDPALKIR